MSNQTANEELGDLEHLFARVPMQRP